MLQTPTTPVPAPAEQVDGLCTLDAYHDTRGHLFPSMESLRWFVRKNRAALVAAGALLMITGRWMADPSRFDAAVVKIGQRAARRAS